MAILILALLIFFIPHLLKATPLRARFVERLGEEKYKGLVAVIMLAGFVGIIIGKATAPFVQVWAAFPAMRHLTMLLMWFAFFFLASSGKVSALKRVTRHPMLWGVVIWSGGHLVVNGDLASLLLFGAFFVYSCFAMIVQNRRGLQKSTEIAPIGHEIIRVFAVTAVYVFVFFMHGILFGVPLR
jgi:uncharacterized membrane protein